MATQTHSIIQMKANNWFAQGLDNKQIEAELAKEGIDERHIPEMLQEIKKLRNARRTTRGLWLILAGAATCLGSCIITLSSSYSNMHMALYGLTSIGILLAFAGLAYIFK